jgi:hypothetical protein
MSIQHYCDSCGKSVERNVVSDRLKGSAQVQGKKFEYEVMVAVEGTWNAGDLCEDCLIALIKMSQKKRATAGKAG